MNKIIENILYKLSTSTDLLAALAALPSSQLNSFLLELFRRKSRDVSTPELLRQYQDNRFVSPSTADPLQLKATELEWLRQAQARGFQPLTLSPLSPFGTCSAVGFVDQNNVVSALRGTEVVADATNVLALHIASEFKNSPDKDLVLRYATTHRHVRGQHFSNPAFTAHFSILCLASGGFDTGNYAFEIAHLREHLALLFQLLTQKFPEDRLYIRFYLKAGAERFRALLQQRDAFWQDKPFDIKEDFDHQYYQLIQFKIFLKGEDQDIDLADGGVVDWTQRLLGNRKHRLFISGVGLELVEKLKN